MDLEKIIEKANSTGGLMKMLQVVQKEFGYIPEESITLISEKFAVPKAKIYGVITFYSLFRLKPTGKNLIKICRGTACHVSGSLKLLEDLREHLHLNENEDTTKDRLFTVQELACLGCCSLAPAMMIGEEVFGKLNKDKVKEILGRYK